MHHSRDIPESENMRRLIKDLQLGPTGEFPEGKLDPTDEGEIKIAIGSQDGKVVIQFGKPVAWIGFSPQQARALAESIRKQSYLAQG